MLDTMCVKRSIMSACMLLVIFLMIPADGFAWWNDQWQYRRKISFDTTAAGADIKENLSEVPVLLRLHTGNFNFMNAKQSGEDIRFVSSDDVTLLKHHIEKFDIIDEMALIWVKIPKLSANVNLEHIWMYYGNESAVGGQSSAETFDGAQIAVYHFGELEGVPEDATAKGLQVGEFVGGQGLPGAIGNGILLGGGTDKMILENSPLLNFSNGFTFSAMIRMTHEQGNAYLLFREENDQRIAVGIDGTKLYAELVDGAGNSVTTEKSADIALDAWHYLAVTIVPEERITLYIDGIEMGWVNLAMPIPSMETEVWIGSSPSGENAFAGELDEVRIAGTARTMGWIRGQYAALGPEGKLFALDEEVMGAGSGGMPVFYLATIMKNITLDGWAVISCLMILAVGSWLVILNKSMTLFFIERENRAFLASYVEQDDPTQLMTAGERFSNSNLYQVYASGCKKLKDRLNFKVGLIDAKNEKNNSEECSELLGSRSLNSVRSTLEKGYMEQSKRLNDWLVILTLAISGGPFLGLLGTVWGVMNTFAAMAEAGEANIMAIAPGIASALSTTVVGLLVAIPALFGYNYITGKIKNIMADLTVFVDQFAVMVEEKHGRTS